MLSISIGSLKLIMAYVTMKTIYWKITKYLIGSIDINLMGTQALLGLILSHSNKAWTI